MSAVSWNEARCCEHCSSDLRSEDGWSVLRKAHRYSLVLKSLALKTEVPTTCVLSFEGQTSVRRSMACYWTEVQSSSARTNAGRS